MFQSHSLSLGVLTTVLLACGDGSGVMNMAAAEVPASPAEMSPVSPAASDGAPSVEPAMPAEVQPTQEGPPPDLVRAEDPPAMGGGSSDGDDVVEPPREPMAPAGDG